MDYCWLVVLICICIIDFVLDLVNCFDLLIVSYIFLLILLCALFLDCIVGGGICI